MEKIENQEIRDYAIELAANTFESCNLFTQVFGKNFAKRRAIMNVATVYTNDFSRTVNGYRSLTDASITLCERQQDALPLKLRELQKDRKKITILLHEMLHAILTKSKQECKRLKIQYGTGILECYINSTETIEVR